MRRWSDRVRLPASRSAGLILLLAATLSLAIAFAMRRFGLSTEAIRALSRDPRWILAALLAAAVLALAFHLLLFGSPF